MMCANCGCRLEEDSVFCQNCGMRLNAEEASNQSHEIPTSMLHQIPSEQGFKQVDVDSSLGPARVFISTKWGMRIAILAIVLIIGFFIVPNLTQGPVSGGHREYISFTVRELRNLMQNEYNIYRRYVHGNPIALTGEIAETTTRTLTLRVPSSSWAANIETSRDIKRAVNDSHFRGDTITVYGIADIALGDVPIVRRAANNRPPNATIVTLAEVRRR